MKCCISPRDFPTRKKKYVRVSVVSQITIREVSHYRYLMESARNVRIEWATGCGDRESPHQQESSRTHTHTRIHIYGLTGGARRAQGPGPFSLITRRAMPTSIAIISSGRINNASSRWNRRNCALSVGEAEFESVVDCAIWPIQSGYTARLSKRRGRSPSGRRGTEIGYVYRSVLCVLGHHSSKVVVVWLIFVDISDGFEKSSWHQSCYFYRSAFQLEGFDEDFVSTCRTVHLICYDLYLFLVTTTNFLVDFIIDTCNPNT